jgi:hypothetical protein
MFGKKSTHPSRREILCTIGLAMGAIIAPGRLRLDTSEE